MTAIDPKKYVFFPSSLEYAEARAELLRTVSPAKLSSAKARRLTARALGHQDWEALRVAINAGDAKPSLLNQSCRARKRRILCAN